MNPIAVYIETSPRRCFAAALEWPGWCRSGRDEAGALQALLDYLPRYKGVVGRLGRELRSTGSVEDLRIEERLSGDASTDFGTPGAIPAADRRPLSDRELRRQLEILGRCWAAFDTAARSAEGRTLTTGPRGGGRVLDKIRAHLADSDAAYLGRLGGGGPGAAAAGDIRNGFAQAAAGRISGEIPDVGPRGGNRWPVRYAVRRSAWHALDHAWEIEDRMTGGA